MKLTKKLLNRYVRQLLREFKSNNDQAVASQEDMISAFHNTTAMSQDDPSALQEAAPSNIIFSEPSNPNMEYVKTFLDGLKSNPSSEFLSDLSEESLAKKYLIMAGDQLSGVACTTSGHMGSGWNNGTTRGVLRALMGYTRKEFGGKTGDHFDGGLGGYYRSLGMTVVYKVSVWNDLYAPSGWRYKPVDVFNPKKSVYAEALSEYKSDPASAPNKMLLLEVESGKKVLINPHRKIIQYSDGMPDVIFRMYA
jgi:hypothetical protein